ncbi:sugar phosphate isomerase/epimerase [Chelativorans sp. AA-79]|uniref:sugar phosphate isomerase/epimerase family protein n=1 Tax=Chelativorans sp. AA-79 TaxID=3028735 RepID=UPI0023F93795|nr:sugar phosphate isomerase/epimerase [Chelativorans sp. AA-79]WEX10612.1 sugar phosphate isomerase/epimerase [Chelativorans sp. AA-79]
MRLGIFAKTFPGNDPGTVMSAARRAGYAAVQYNMACSGLPSMPEAVAPEVAAAVARAARANGIAIAAVSGTYNMIHPDPAVRADGLRRLAVLAEASSALGTDLITLCTGTRDPADQWRAHPDNRTPEAWRDLLVEMEKAVLLAERHDVRLGVEPELANVVDSAEKARRLIDEIGSPRLVVVLDPANLFEEALLPRQREIVSEAIGLLAGRIVMAHAKDRDAAGRFVTAGRGVLDYKHYLARLKAAGFSGDLVTHGLAASEAPAVAAFLSGLLAELP